jgi:hypothetical protein
MDNIQTLAAEIAFQTISQSWPYYALVVALTLVSSAAGAFLSSYFSRRAEHQAISADFESIKSQLRETTILTESIHTELKHHFDRAHTIEVLRREKLEAYVEKITEAAENLTREVNEKIFNSQVQYDPSAYSTASMLQTIYLPEFDEVHAHFSLVCAELRQWIVEGMKYSLQKKAEGIQVVVPTQEYMARYPAHYQPVLVAVSAIESKAREVGRLLIKV